MQVFKTDSKIYLASELKSWALTTGFVMFLFLALRLFSTLTQVSILVGIAVLLLLKLGDMVTQFHIKQIKIDTCSNQVSFLLKSIMSGQKIKTYNLGQVKV